LNALKESRRKQLWSCKRLLEYDDVMNAQREVVYKRRRHALFGERKLDIANMLYDTCEINH
jgi:preprotein translocase subunit SecA